jgi:ABC-type uncharacterized transport system permease subunit
MLDVLQFAGVAGVGIVIGLLQVAKPFLKDERTWPLAAIIIGVAWSMLIAWASGGPYPQAIVTGFVVSLTASGLYSWGQTGKPPSPPTV